MPGDFSNSEHELQWIGDTTNKVETVGGEIIHPNHIDGYIMGDASADWVFPSDFTIEIFGVRFLSAAELQVILAFWEAFNNNRSWVCYYHGADTPTPTLQFLASTDGTAFTRIDGDFTPTIGQKYDYCAERSGSDVRVYLDGSMLAKGTIAGALHDAGRPLRFGQRIGAGSAGTDDRINPLNGAAAAIRITKGVARYNDDNGYTVPDLPLPTEGPA